MNYRWDKKYLYWGVTAFFVIAAASSFIITLLFWQDVRAFIGVIIGAMKPIIYGLSFAYLMIPVMNTIESFIQPLMQRMFRKKKNNRAEKTTRLISVLATICFTVLSITGLIVLAVPQIANASSVFANLPVYATKVNEWINQSLAKNPQLASQITNWFQNISFDLESWFTTQILPQANGLVQSLGSGLYGAVMALFNVLIGFIISIYVLCSKDLFVAQSKRVLYALFKPARANNMIGLTRKTHKIFGGFIMGKMLDSLIVGIICFVFMSIFQWPLAILISIVVGLTNMIPFFGPFIGGIPSALFLLLYDPAIGLSFILFIIVLQQVDGNIIGPRILGSSTGISGFWVLFSLLIGGALFGLVGMLLSVPTFAVIYTLCREGIVKKLQGKGLPAATMEYRNVAKIEDSGRVIKFSSLPPQKKYRYKK